MAHDFVLVTKLMDINGEKTTKTIELNGYAGVTIDLSWQAALNDAQAYLADLDNMTGCQLVSASLNTRLEQDNLFNTFKNAPLAGSDVTDLLKYTVALVANDVLKSAPHTIPSPVVGLFLGTTGPSAHIPDITSGLAASYFENFEPQAGGGPQISDNENVDLAQGSGGILSGVWGSAKR